MFWFKGDIPYPGNKTRENVPADFYFLRITLQAALTGETLPHQVVVKDG